MATTQTVQPVITPSDRLGFTLSLAILIHALLIFGITFVDEDRSHKRYDTMEIVLVQQKSSEPEEAKLLAQANSAGGGDTEETINPGVPTLAPFPDEKPEITTPPLPVETEPPNPAIEKIETLGKEKEIPVVQEMKTEDEIPTPENTKAQVKKTTTMQPLPSAMELLTNSFKIASLSAEIRRKSEEKASRPRLTFISARTKEYKYAAYMEAWRSKVERVGNLNYPEQARQKSLSGSLVLDVALNADGSINEIVIQNSSGEKILDDAAVRIVELAAPYAPFPQNIKEGTDILHIIRTWQFINGKGFRQRS